MTLLTQAENTVDSYALYGIHHLSTHTCRSLTFLAIHSLSLDFDECEMLAKALDTHRRQRETLSTLRGLQQLKAIDAL